MRMLALVVLLLATPAAAQAPVGRVAELSGALSLRPPGGGFAPIGRGVRINCTLPGAVQTIEQGIYRLDIS